MLFLRFWYALNCLSSYYSKIKHVRNTHDVISKLIFLKSSLMVKMFNQLWKMVSSLFIPINVNPRLWVFLKVYVDLDFIFSLPIILKDHLIFTKRLIQIIIYFMKLLIKKFNGFSQRSTYVLRFISFSMFYLRL
jgi:hypothetical protein